MTRSELIRRLADANPIIHRHDIAEAVEILFGEIAAGLARGDRVELRGFGTFTPRKRRARVGRNPGTGAAVEVAEKSVPFFRAGKRLLDRLNQCRPREGIGDPPAGTPRRHGFPE